MLIHAPASIALSSMEQEGIDPIVSLIEACKLNNVEHHAYLQITLEAISAGHPAANVDEVMPPFGFQESA